MLSEQEYVCVNYSKKVRDELKKHLNASVFTKIENGVIIIEIKSNNITYKTAYPDVMNMIFEGKSASHLAADVIPAYRKFILSKFFNKKKECSNDVIKKQYNNSNKGKL